MPSRDQLIALKIGAEWEDPLNETFARFGINTPVLQAAFIGQCGHECGNFRILEENLNYRAETLMKLWPRRFPTREIADQYARNPKKIANMVYSNRMGNRDEASGDGFLYAGKGIIQLTGKDNYTRFAQSLEISVEDAAEYMKTFEGAAQSACWFWETNNLNKFADAGDLKTMTRVINGGFKGMEDRELQFARISKLLGM